jgi:hypothetical protein
LLTPTTDSAAYFKQNGFTDIPVMAVGQPTVEETSSDAVQSLDPAAMAYQLGLSPGQPTLLFVGQYGPEYEQALALFCRTISKTPGVNVLLALHPKVNGEVEQRIIAQYGLQDRIQLLPKNIPTEQALMLADAVLSHSSTMAMQACLHGKKVILAGPQDTGQFNPLRDKNLALQCETDAVLSKAIYQALQEAPDSLKPSRQELFQRIGLPEHAADRIMGYLYSLISGSGS